MIDLAFSLCIAVRRFTPFYSADPTPIYRVLKEQGWEERVELAAAEKAKERLQAVQVNTESIQRKQRVTELREKHNQAKLLEAAEKLDNELDMRFEIGSLG
jgi:hypothetical protein